MHKKNSFKLFKPLFSIIPLLLLLIFHVTDIRSHEESTAADALRLNKTISLPDPATQPQQNQQIPQTQEQQQNQLQEQQQDQLQEQQQQPQERRQNNILSSKAEYEAGDSIVYDLNNHKVYLWSEGYIKYEDIELRAGYIEIDMIGNEVYATGLTDSLGNVTGKPVMTEGPETFEAETMRYNFDTKRGIIGGIITEQEGGILHGHTTKKHEDDHLHMQGGKFTTCDHDEPHFYISLTRAKVIPGNVVITGPAYLVIEDIPLPLAVPFGFFPNQRGRTSGVVFPTYGEEASRGFYLREGGYYFALNEYMDLQLTGDIYSLGSWKMNAASNYRKRYSYNGSFRYAYSHNVVGERGLANYQENSSYNITWQHRQDPKASPNRNLSASVNFGSSSFNKFNTYDPDTYARNTAQSSISFNQRWPDSPFSLTGNIGANQNFSNQTVNMRLPSVNFNMSRQYPFRNPDRVGDSRWYENIELSYRSKVDNRLRTYDTLLFSSQTLGDMQTGFQHDIPVRANFRLLNLLNITPGITYSGVMYTNSIRKTWVEDYYDAEREEVVPSLVTDTIPGIVYGHSINPNFSTGLSQNIYGMFMFRDSRVEAIRHVMTPSVGFSFAPDMEGLMPDYYRTVQRDTLGNETTYSIFDNGMYGTPSLRGRAGSVSFSLANNIEMKVRDTEDPESESRKVKILDRLNFSSSYNVYADSMNWSTINMTGSTGILDNQIRFNFNAVMDPYALDDNFRRYNVSQWSVDRSPGRITRAGLSMTMNLRSAAAPSGQRGADAAGPGTGPMPPNGTDPMMGNGGDITREEDEIFGHMDDIDGSAHYYGGYVDFNVPWNVNIRYNLNYTKPRDESQINQTLNFSGDMALTPNWRIQFSSGYDFKAGDFTMTNINIYRDLHCWEMRFGVVPFGSRKSWNFTIQVKASLLNDLKYHTQRSWYDNFFR